MYNILEVLHWSGMGSDCVHSDFISEEGTRGFRLISTTMKSGTLTLSDWLWVNKAWILFISTVQIIFRAVLVESGFKTQKTQTWLHLRWEKWWDVVFRVDCLFSKACLLIPSFKGLLVLFFWWCCSTLSQESGQMLSILENNTRTHPANQSMRPPSVNSPGTTSDFYQCH